MEIVLLNEKKSIKQLVAVDTNESILKFIETELSKNEYSFIVTAENLKFAKEKMADLNKSIKFIDTFRKDKVNTESVAIDEFKDNVKAYLALIDTKREQIKKDVEVFERETKDRILKELSLYCEDFIKTQGIRDNFKDVNIVDLMVLGSVTAKGALTKKAKEVIESRVNACKSKQDKYDMRLLTLENLSYQNGLETPLTITHIQGIISLDSDEEYDLKLKELIGSEMERQNTIKANIQKQANEQAQRDAHQEVLDGQNRINSIFNDIAKDTILTIDEKIRTIDGFDFMQFAQLENFARAKSQSVIYELNLFKDELSKKQNAAIPTKAVETVRETIPFTPEEKAQIIKDKESGKKVVYIDVHLQFKVKETVADEKIIAKVNQMLKSAGFDESLLSVEVVQ